MDGKKRVIRISLKDIHVELYFTNLTEYEMWDTHEKCGGTKQFRSEQDIGRNLGRKKTHETHTIFKNSVPTSR
jgi:hypothetical protein